MSRKKVCTRLSTFKHLRLLPFSLSKWKFSQVLSCSLLLLFLSGVAPASAFNFDIGEISGSVDTTLTWAIGVRTGDPVDKSDLDNMTMRDWTFDQGDVYSNTFKITPEVQLNWENYGFFGRATAYWDTVIDRGSSDRADYPFDQGWGDGWSDAAQDELGKGIDLYDAYVFGSYDIDNFLGMGYAPLDIRLGNQAFNWGEGSIYFDGINSTNAFDLSKLSQPGSEIKEATIPVPAAMLQIGLFDSLSIDTYYQFGWSESKLPPVGTFYGDDTDFFGQGGKWIANNATGGSIVYYRIEDDEAKDSGQFGINSKYTVGDFELGAYYTRSHQTLPLHRYYVPPSTGTFPDDNEFQFTYLENINMFGASAATTVKGWALAGEVAWRPEAAVINIHPNTFLNAHLSNWGSSFTPNSNVGTVNPGDVVDTYEKRDTVHAQLNAMKQLGKAFGFDTTWVFLTVAADMLPGDTTDIPSWSNEDEDASSLAWGYSVDVDSTWYNVAPGLNVTPGFSFVHHVNGYSHFNGNFAEGQRSVQLRVGVDYGEDWLFNLNYNKIFNDEYTYLENGDNVTFSASYKF